MLLFSVLAVTSGQFTLGRNLVPEPFNRATVRGESGYVTSYMVMEPEEPESSRKAGHSFDSAGCSLDDDMEEIERHMQELGNDDSLSEDAFTCSYSSHPFLCILDVYYPLPGGREMVWEVNRSEGGSKAFNIYLSLVPRPRPLTREKGSGDLQPIPRALLS